MARQLPDIAANAQCLYELARRVYERTEGNPLFMVTVVEDLAMQSRNALNGNATAPFEIVLNHAPDSVQAMIHQQVARLSEEEQELLEATSVAGAGFSAAEAAAGLGVEAMEAERIATLLARKQQFLRFHGVSDWPDGTIAGRYRFLHVLHQQVLYERVPPARRVQLHKQIGARLEAAYGQDTNEVAAALAVHFVQGRDAARAVTYLTQASNTAIRRFGYQEAISQLTQALRILHTLPETAERDQQELLPRLTLFGPLIALKGYGAAAVRDALDKARVLSEKVGDTSLQASLLSASGVVAMLRAELSAARAAGEQALRLAHSAGDSIQLIYASLTFGQTLLYQGELTEAQHILSQGIALPHPPHYDPYGTLMDLWIACLSDQALTLGLRGYPDQGQAGADGAVQHARQLGHPYTIAFALSVACTLRFLCGENEKAQALAETEIALAREHGFSYLETLGMTLLGSSLMRQGRRSEEIALTRQGLAAQRELGMAYGRPVFLIFIAEALVARATSTMGLWF